MNSPGFWEEVWGEYLSGTKWIALVVCGRTADSDLDYFISNVPDVEPETKELNKIMVIDQVYVENHIATESIMTSTQ